MWRWRKGWIVVGVLSLVLLAGWLIVAYVTEPSFAAEPARERAARPAQVPARGYYDVWGRHIGQTEAARLAQTPQGEKLLSAEQGAVHVTPELIALGRSAFYEETFGNELFLTEVAGLIDGPLPLGAFVRAIAALKGGFTTDLVVEVQQSATLGKRRFQQGERLHTGLDVLAGSLVPLGMKVAIQAGHTRVGITCALCHVTLNRNSGQVIEGAPNSDLQLGVMLALASNSAAFLSNAGIEPLSDYESQRSAKVRDGQERLASLPDPAALEQAVDEVFLGWPPGSFDSTPDLVANPSQIPSSFTRGGHPYGWTGFSAAGPFRGLSVLNNNVHALNADPLSNAAASQVLFGLDKEVFLGAVLQNAAERAFRFDPHAGKKPSEFLATLAPEPRRPGLGEQIKLPSYPNASYLSPNGFWISMPGHAVWEHVNAMSAFQNTLVPPVVDPGVSARDGRSVFERAGCAECHAGPYRTNNRVLPLAEVGTEGARAPALRNLESVLAPPLAWPFSLPVPLPRGARPIPVPIDAQLERQLELAWAFRGSAGGYKVPALVGLAFTAPYLHDGGVAVGPDIARDLGLPGTYGRSIRPEPRNSLRALIDRGLRAGVVAANQRSDELTRVHVQGIGHAFWVDAQSGFTQFEQDALLDYLLAADSLPE